MKNKTTISIVLALVMIVSTFTVVNTAVACSNKGDIDFSKKVWDEVCESWEDEIDAQVGETVSFNITLTYHKNPSNPNPWRLYDIQIKDILPDCLEFANNVNINSPGNTIDYTEENVGNKVFWNFTEPMLNDGESLYIEFDALVVESEEVDNQNIALVYSTECGHYDLESEADAWVHVVIPAEPEIDIDKKVYDSVLEEWVDDGITEYICVYDLLTEGQYIDFKINVSNTGNVDLSNVVVTDILPEFLTYHDSNILPDYVSPDSSGNEIIWDLGTLAKDTYVVIEFDATIYGPYFLPNDMASGENFANVTANYEEQELEEYDSVDITINKRVEVDKEVSNDGGETWVKSIPEVIKDEVLQFKITTTFHGDEDDRVSCGVVGDFLESGCLNYLQTVSVKVAGNELDPESNEYPDIYPDHDDFIVVCGDEVNVTEIIEDLGIDECGTLIIWDFKEAWNFELHDGDSVEIIFEVNVTHYCECLVTNWALSLLWGCDVCDPCNYQLDIDYANVTCTPPDTTFEKKVYDGEGWSDEAEGYVGETMRFKLEFEYYGNIDLNDVRIKDELPCVLEFADNVDSGDFNITVEVSADGKTIWFNSSEDKITDGDTVAIEFDALVTGVTGDCGECDAINKAWLFAYEVCEQLLFQYYDEVSITTSTNYPPCPPIIRENTQGEIGEELTFYVKTTDLDGDNVAYGLDWDGDDSVDEWTGYQSSGVEITVTHTYTEAGAYPVKAKAKDEHGSIGDWGNTITVEINEPAEEYTLTINIEGNGSVAIDPEKSVYGEGEEVELTANADEGSVFSHWDGDLTGETNPAIVTMDGDKVITAYFTEEEIKPVSICFAKFGIKTVSATITNNLEENLTGVEWNMTITGGILGNINEYINGTDKLEPGAKSISLGWKSLLPRFGKLNAEVNVVVPGYEDVYTGKASGFVIGPFAIFM